MRSQVLSSVRRHALLAPGDGVLVACSGGPDSTALLHVLATLRRPLDVHIEAAYVNHGLRPEADAEARHVLSLARSLDVRAEVLRVTVPRRASLQEAARAVRLEALERLARKRGLARVALGHTRTDQAETVLMRILRGTGPRGLAGIPFRRGMFVRPLLAVGRREIVSYLAEHELEWLEDPSNEDRRFLRVRVRHEVLPGLREINPRVEEALARLADNARDERGDAVSPPLGRAHLRALAELCAAPGGTRWLSLPGGKTAEVRVLDRPRKKAPRVQVHVPGPGRYDVPGQRAALRLARGLGAAARARASAAFDPRAVDFPLTLRTRRPGDRIRLEVGTKKISDVLIDAKVPRSERDRVLLLCRGDDVLWVAGLRQAAGTRPRGRACVTASMTWDVDPVAGPSNNEA